MICFYSFNDADEINSHFSNISIITKTQKQSPKNLLRRITIRCFAPIDKKLHLSKWNSLCLSCWSSQSSFTSSLSHTLSTASRTVDVAKLTGAWATVVLDFATSK
ncbi:unnamed protein product [Acanthoscelides obtectus]|uniref:Uncharacterized protein n=1 Tax=Acanthoscelides obtectus TaxID=200917 RepID=A0A9P0LWE0_ACAOB|nr:unnamed protein product [Acanthoscelides obtectus]CAK1670417.1 hypothetical protein AOBTE_LOCUS27621 [Acanthoscelides obtectus]